MNNFGRALRLALVHRWTFAASLVCALIVAVLWGSNIGTVYPFVEVVFQGHSLHEWVDKEIAKVQHDAAELDAEVARLDDRLKADNADRQTLTRQRYAASDKLADKHRWIEGLNWLKRNVIGPYLPHDAFQTLCLIVCILLGGTLIKSMFLIWHQVLVGRLTQLATYSLRKQFHRRTLSLDVANFGAEGTSDMMSRITYDVDSLSSGLVELLGKVVREPLKAVACVVGAAFISRRLLVLSLVLAPVTGFLIHWLAKALKRANRRAMEEMSHMYGILEETFQGIKVVKAFTMERHERHRFHRNSKKFYLKSMRITRYDSLTRPLIEVLGMLTICVAIMAGAYLVLNRQTHLLGIRMSDEPLSLSALLVFFGLLAGIGDPARKLSEVFSRIQRAAAAADRIYQFIDRQPLVVDPPQSRRIGRHHRDLVFERIQFHYQPTQKVLEDIDLRIEFGETIAIVGPNGCGKTTLANLVPRFFDPIGGRVLLDGVDLRDVRLRDLRGQIGLVTQETLLFDDTVYNNIRYGSPHATREQVLSASERALAHRFIEEKLAHGYESEVGPRGSQLSGGQRQRIALARAILRDPAILVLDEATSQVDLESEQAIQKVLEQFIHNRTTIIITHRMATLALADRIVVMQAGRILDVGSHEELLRRCDLYSRLYNIQFREIA